MQFNIDVPFDECWLAEKSEKLCVWGEIDAVP